VWVYTWGIITCREVIRRFDTEGNQIMTCLEVVMGARGMRFSMGSAFYFCDEHVWERGCGCVFKKFEIFFFVKI
jgi:hypothetical protein